MTPPAMGDTVIYGFVPKLYDKCHLFLAASLAKPLRLNPPHKEPQQMAKSNLSPSQQDLFLFTAALSDIVKAAPFQDGTKLLGLVTLASATIVSDIKPEKWETVVNLLKDQLDRVLREGQSILDTVHSKREEAPVV